jgi:tetratricopeptide (TPR) repeat protein
MRNRTMRRQAARAKKAVASGLDKTDTPKAVVGIAFLLVAATLLLYSPVRNYHFIDYDDNVYIFNNPHVTDGISWQTIRWSLDSTEQSNWHPLTWLSHALDCQLFGLDAGDHHLTSVVIHALNVLLLFLVLKQATGAVGRSFVVAALFAWHPFNVESVAWVAERKSLLSTFFVLLTLAAYGWYTRQPRLKSLAVVAGVFVLALASKPMAVTLPFVLLLLDYWPLQRVAGWIQPRPRSPIPQEPPSHLLLEKLPLFALSAASAVLTVWAQKSGGALRTFEAFSLGVRLENALHSYVIYIWKTVWPSGFALFYPHPHTLLPAWEPTLAAALLLAIGIEVWRQRTTRPYLIVGWLCFLGTLFPVLGIVQVGDQAMADRYAYLPTIGLFVMIVWGASDFFDRLRVRTPARWVVASVVLLILGWLTSQQLGFWEDTVTLWSQTLQVTANNPETEKRLAFALAARGETDQAMLHFVNAVRLDPKDVPAHVNLGAYYASQGRLQDGIHEFETVVKLTDDRDLSADDRSYRSSALLNLGFAYTMLKDYAKALMSLPGANQSDSTSVDRTIEQIDRSLAAVPSEGGCLKLSLLLRAKGKDKEASSILESAIKANPEYTEALELLNFLNARRT